MILIKPAPGPMWAAGVATGLCTSDPVPGATPLTGADQPVLHGLQQISSSRQFQLWGRGWGFSGCGPCPAGVPNPSDQRLRLQALETGAAPEVRRPHLRSRI